MGNPRNRRLVGWWLVLWGVLLSLVSNHVLLGWENLWPLIMTTSGVIVLRVFQQRLSFGVVFGATWAILLGGFLTLFAAGILDWGRMSMLWPIIPLIIGTSFIVAGASCPPGNTAIIVGGMVVALSSASFLYEYGLISSRAAAPFLRFWPLTLVLAGFVLMKRDAVRNRDASPPGGHRSNPYDAGALSEDVENDILRRVRSARDPGDATIALVRELKTRFDRFSWVGVYRLQGDTLILDDAEFLGLSPEHRRIHLDEGVCGAAARVRETQVVPDVCADDRYLACSPTVKSEIVVPILAGGNVIGVLDIDSDLPDAFSEDDRRFLESLVAKASRLIHRRHISPA